jgi:23S rRNA (cytidine1920-2'-O)/16S rRNA (cytidine1409-2'-O)-methyltransferase
LRERLDKILVSNGLVKSRELAKALILEGKVFVDGRKITKAGTQISQDAEIILRDPGIPFVSRGGLKLDAALNFFAIDVQDKVIIDVGSSTGGFTDCLLKRGARKIYCIDVGYGQLAWKLRQDPRVTLLERTNIRNLDKLVQRQDPKVRSDVFDDMKTKKIDMAAIDVSFISLKKVVPETMKFLKEKGEVLALVKPQFEVGKGEVGKGGIVRDEEKRLSAVREVQEDLENIGLQTGGVFESPVPGQKGNIEYFLYMKR